jgi:putative DNA primase/helicase
VDRGRPAEIVAALEAIKPPADLAAITALLRELADTLGGEDDLTVSSHREAAVRALGKKLQAPAKLVDAAFVSLRAGGQDGSHQGGTVELVTPEPWHEEVDGAGLLDHLVATITRYLVLDRHAVVAVALWALHAHAFEAARITPRLAITSPVKRCAKTLLLEILEHLVPRPLNVANVTAAAVFRGVEQYRPTLLVDEADTFLGDKDELRGILNSGHRCNGRVLRTVGDQHEIRAFSTFAPVAIAMIGRLPDTLADRSIPVSMRRKRRDEDVEVFRGDRSGQLEALRCQATRWALDHWDGLAGADPEVPAQLHDREADNWRPLLAIADAAGGEWPAKAREAAGAMSASAAADSEDAPGVLLLGDLRAIFDAEGGGALFTDRLLARLHDRQDRPWAEWRKDKPLTAVQLARLLRPFGIRPKQVRIGETSMKGYERTAFEDAFARYLPPLDPKHPKQVNGDSDLREVSTRNTEAPVSGGESPQTPASTGVVSGVSGRKGETGTDMSPADPELVV